jgi:ribose-phosphate pyrophosphokinase
MNPNGDDFVILPTGKNDYTARGVAECLEKPLGTLHPSDFGDGHIMRRSVTSVRRKDVFIVNTFVPGQPYKMEREVLQLLNAAMKAGALRKTAVMPKPVGDRSDRVSLAGEAIDVQIMAQNLEANHLDELMILQSHFDQFDAVVRKPTVMISGIPLFAYYLQKTLGYKPEETCFVDADGGAAKITQKFMQVMGSQHYATVFQGRNVVDKGDGGKQRYLVSGVEHIQGRHCVFIDDVVQGGGTIKNAAQAVKEHGALSAVACIAHLGLSEGAHVNLNDEAIDQIIGLDTVYHPPEHLEEYTKLKVISAVPAIANCIQRLHDGQSTRLWTCLDIDQVQKKPDSLRRLVGKIYGAAREVGFSNPLLQERVENLYRK